MPKRTRVKSYNDLLTQAGQLMARAGAGGRRVLASQPVNHIGGGHIAADRTAATSEKGYRRMQRIADIFNRYADNMKANNADLGLAYTDKESGNRIASARSRKLPSSVYMNGEKMGSTSVEYKPVSGKDRMKELREKFANRAKTASAANGGKG